MNLATIIKKSADYVLRSYLDAPTPLSLEMLSAPGERESVTIENKTCFVYVLLTDQGEKYNEIGIPRLPCRAEEGNMRPTFRNRMRRLLREQEYPHDYQSIEQALQRALAESQIVECREGVYGLFGVTEKEIRQLLYLPAETVEEADAKINTYRARVNAILQPDRICCELKIKPLTKPGNLKRKPLSLRESYFGSGC